MSKALLIASGRHAFVVRTHLYAYVISVDGGQWSRSDIPVKLCSLTADITQRLDDNLLRHILTIY